jgi:cell division protease FtsH
MVTDFGMSELGPIDFGPQQDMDEFGRSSWFEPSSISQAMAEKVDNEVKKIIDAGYKQALDLVKKQRKLLDKVAVALIKTETLEREDFEKIVGDKNGK